VLAVTSIVTKKRCTYICRVCTVFYKVYSLVIQFFPSGVTIFIIIYLFLSSLSIRSLRPMGSDTSSPRSTDSHFTRDLNEATATAGGAPQERQRRQQQRTGDDKIRGGKDLGNDALLMCVRFMRFFACI